MSDMAGTLAKQARRLNARAPRGRGLPALLLLTDEARLPDPCGAAARLPRGAGVILRHYGAPSRAALAARLAALCRRRGLKLLVAEDWRLAAAVRAQGVHLPERPQRRFRPRPGWLVTAAAHSAPALVRAARLGADAALLSPAFPTRSHPGRPALGAVRFARLAHAAPLPVYALGGVNGENARRLRGAIGVAAIGALAELDEATIWRIRALIA
jgi:thiamine-phosphate pyrophosphorylase